MKRIRTSIRSFITALAVLATISGMSQGKSRLIVNQIESSGMLTTSKQMGDIVRFEIQKTKQYEVVEHYDVIDQLKGSGIKVDSCRSIKCLTEMGIKMEASKVVSGRASRYGERIVISLRLIDVASGKIEKSEVMEFMNVEKDIQQIFGIAVKKMLNLEIDPVLENYLVHDGQVNNEVVVNTLSLNGPRMGVGYVGGEMGKVLERSEEDGGYGAMPILTQFGYQHEVQYMGAGNFQGLFEFIGTAAGMEQGLFIPTVSILNGFRNNKTGIEVAFGPTFTLSKKADAYQAGDGSWKLSKDWVQDYDTLGMPITTRPSTISRLDSRGDVKLETGWLWAVGKTFRSGHLNIPVNAYFSHKKDGWIVGASVGFNLRHK